MHLGYNRTQIYEKKNKYVFIDENYIVIKPQGSKFSMIILVSENINILI